jgi:hypothetical protein
MKATRISATVATFIFAAGAMLFTSCSSSSPTSPDGIGQGKGIYRGMVEDAGGDPVEGALIKVNGAVGIDPATGVQAESAADGTFTVLVDETQVADPDPNEITATDAAGNEYTFSVADDELDPEDPGDPEEVSNGIGQCVSECVHSYKNGTPEGYRDLPTKNGKGNGTRCVELCKGYRGGLPGDADCNPFYATWDDEFGTCIEEDVPIDPGGEPAGVASAPGPANAKKPKKPKSNNGKGNGNS